jgi:hypothetical protein
MLPAAEVTGDDSTTTHSTCSGALDTAVRILLNYGSGSQPGGALRYLVHLFLPAVSGGVAAERGGRVTTSSSSWQGRTGSAGGARGGSYVHMLSMRRYLQHGVGTGGTRVKGAEGEGEGESGESRDESDTQQYVSGGYYKAPYVYLALGLVSADDSQSDGGGSGGAITVANKALRRLCGVFGSSKLSVAAILQLWEAALLDIEQHVFQEKIPKQKRDRRKNKHNHKNYEELQVEVASNTIREEEKKKRRRQEKQMSFEYGALQWAIGATEFLHFTLLGLMDKYPLGGDVRKGEANKVSGDIDNAESMSRVKCKCALCGKHGKYQATPENSDATARGDDASTLLRCARCQIVYYCCKSHQKKHWGAHRKACKAPSPCPSPPAPGRSSSFFRAEETASSSSTAKTQDSSSMDRGRAARSRLQPFTPQVMTRLSGFLRSFLLFTASASTAASPSEAIESLRMLLVSSLMEALGTIFLDVSLCVKDLKQQLTALREGQRSGGEDENLEATSMVHLLQTELCDIERNGRTFLLEVLSPLLSLAVDRTAGSSTANISRQAAMTTLSRLSLYMGYASGPDVLRSNLDYIVDAVCLYLRQLQRTTKQAMDFHHQMQSLSGLTAGAGVGAVTVRSTTHQPEDTTGMHVAYDGRVVVVVGSVLEAILAEKGPQQGGGEPSSARAIDMLLRDMVSETLSTIDLLSSMATTSSGNGVGDGLLVQVAPLLNLMHSLVRTSVKPLAGIPDCFLTPTDRVTQGSTSQGGLSPQETSSRGHSKGLFSTPHFMSDMMTLVDKSTPQETKSVSAVTSPSLPALGFAKSKTSELDAMIRSLGEFQRQWQSTRDNMLRQSEHQEGDIDASEGFSFPGEEEEDEDEDGGGQTEAKDEDEDDEEAPPAPELDLVVKVLEKCHYFMACADLSAQVSVVKVMMSGFSRLAKNKKLCLPALHKAWPSIMTRVKELRALYVLYHQHHFSGSGAAEGAAGSELSIQKLFLLPHLLQLVSLLAFLCGDFVSMKFKEDLWPELMIILHVCSQEVLLSLPHADSGLLAPPSTLTSKTKTKQATSPAKREKLDDLIFAPASLPVAASLELNQPPRTETAAPHKSTAEAVASYPSSQTSSKYSLLEKLKSSLLTCLSQLASMKIRDINAGPISGSCIVPDDGEDSAIAGDVTMANPLRPIAPLCIWLLLPLVAASPSTTGGAHTPGSNHNTSRGERGEESTHARISDTLLQLSRLNVPFAVTLFEILAVNGEAPSPTHAPGSCPVSETQQHPLIAWEGLRAHPVIEDSYTALNKHSSCSSSSSSSRAMGTSRGGSGKLASFSSAPVLQLLLGPRNGRNSALVTVSQECLLYL